ncbi:MAG TPA: hypothetical protein VG796_12400 [Verrucomicrobiales bacterium]|nr:hypothetical protein [Verrucomicrobiales bacterium]
MNRTGKIARLPLPLRTSINHRLDRNDPGRRIITWLNSLPAVKKILRELFHNKPITEQNLSEWRNGGYLEWQIRRDFFADTRESLHDAAELEEISPFMADHAARLLSARILNAVRKWNGDLDDPALANLKHLSGLLRAISTLRRGDHSAARLKIQQSIHDRANVPEDDAESPGERRLLEGLRRLTYGIPRDTDADDKPPPQFMPSMSSMSSTQSIPSDPSDPSPAKSDLIAPNPTTSSVPNPTPSEPAPSHTHTHTHTLTPSEPAPPSEPASSPSSSQPADSPIHDSTIHDSPPSSAPAHSPSSPPPSSAPPAPPMSAEEFNRLRHHNPDPMPEWREKILHPIPPWLTIPYDPPTPRPLKSIMPYRC